MRSLTFIFAVFLSCAVYADSFCNVILPSRNQKNTLNLEEIVKAKQPLTFEKAVGYALSALPEGEMRNLFVENIKDSFTLDESKVKNRKIWSPFGTRLKYKWGERKDGKKIARKVIWNLRTPKTKEAALGQIFKAMEFIVEPSFQPIQRINVYYHGKKFYVDQFVDNATALLNLEEGLYQSVDKDVELPVTGRAGVLLGLFKRLSKNFIWLSEYQTFRKMGLTSEYHEILNSGDPGRLREVAAKRFGPEISIQWYLRHLRNLGTIATVSLLAILIPETAVSYHHQQTIENLENTTVSWSEVQSAQKILSQSDLEMRSTLQTTINNSRSENLSPGEVNFLRDVDSSLEKPAPK